MVQEDLTIELLGARGHDDAVRGHAFLTFKWGYITGYDVISCLTVLCINAIIPDGSSDVYPYPCDKTEDMLLEATQEQPQWQDWKDRNLLDTLNGPPMAYTRSQTRDRLHCWITVIFACRQD